MRYPQINRTNTSWSSNVNQGILAATAKLNLARPRLNPVKLENFRIAVFLLSYERGGGLGYSWLH
jgi:hypothetical protein